MVPAVPDFKDRALMFVHHLAPRLISIATKEEFQEFWAVSTLSRDRKVAIEMGSPAHLPLVSTSTLKW